MCQKSCQIIYIKLHESDDILHELEDKSNTYIRSYV